MDISFHELNACMWRSVFKKPEKLDLGPNIPLADKDDIQEESSEHVAAVNESEEYFKRLDGLAGLAKVSVNDKMNTFDCPQYSKDQKKFQVENLK